MEPIVSPWIVYLITRLDEIIGLCIIGCFVCTIMLFIMFMEIVTDGELTHTKLTKILLVACSIMVAAIVLLPSKDTVIAILVSQHMTPDNIALFGNSVEGCVDYIFEQIKALSSSK